MISIERKNKRKTLPLVQFHRYQNPGPAKGNPEDQEFEMMEVVMEVAALTVVYVFVVVLGVLALRCSAFVIVFCVVS